MELALKLVISRPTGSTHCFYLERYWDVEIYFDICLVKVKVSWDLAFPVNIQGKFVGMV